VVKYIGIILSQQNISRRISRLQQLTNKCEITIVKFYMKSNRSNGRDKKMGGVSNINHHHHHHHHRRRRRRRRPRKEFELV
jgi:hypothetical protein